MFPRSAQPHTETPHQKYPDTVNGFLRHFSRTAARLDKAMGLQGGELPDVARFRPSWIPLFAFWGDSEERTEEMGATLYSLRRWTETGKPVTVLEPSVASLLMREGSQLPSKMTAETGVMTGNLSYLVRDHTTSVGRKVPAPYLDVAVRLEVSEHQTYDQTKQEFVPDDKELVTVFKGLTTLVNDREAYDAYRELVVPKTAFGNDALIYAERLVERAHAQTATAPTTTTDSLSSIDALLAEFGTS